MSNPTRLHHLLYTSEADMPGEEASRLAAVEAIARAARPRNAKLQLTGALLYVRGSFIQVLEGPLASVETVFETICCDLRHRRVRLAELAAVPERLFGEWSMACIAQDGEPTRLRLNRDLEEVYFSVSVNASGALKQMRALIDGQRAKGSDAAAA